MIEKKKNAAIAAVLHYLACEKEQMAEASETFSEQKPQTQSVAVGVQPWALSGRQAQMQMRNLVQMKAFH